MIRCTCGTTLHVAGVIAPTMLREARARALMGVATMLGWRQGLAGGWRCSGCAVTAPAIDRRAS